MHTILLALLIGLVNVSCDPSPQPPQQDGEGQTWYSISKFVDGDTFWVDDGSEKGLKIRLIGIDSPEPRSVYGRPPEPFGTEASQVMEDLIRGHRVRLEYDLDPYDRYGRTLAYVHLDDGTFVNAEMVRLGYAEVKTYPPNVKYQDMFYELQVEAREAGRGMWGAE